MATLFAILLISCGIDDHKLKKQIEKTDEDRKLKKLGLHLSDTPNDQESCSFTCTYSPSEERLNDIDDILMKLDDRLNEIEHLDSIKKDKLEKIKTNLEHQVVNLNQKIKDAKNKLNTIK